MTEEFTPDQIKERKDIEDAFRTIWKDIKAYQDLDTTMQRTIWTMFVHGYLKGREAKDVE
jgi:hypothetical protein